MRVLALLPFLALGACTTTGDYGQRGTCRSEPASRFVGQVATAEIGWKLQTASDAEILRWVPPRTAVTMDFNPNRVTVSYDDNMVITSAKCG